MVLAVIVALLFGIVAGLRTFAAPAIYFLARGPLAAGIVLSVLAVVELVGDKLPTTPARTRPMPFAVRLLSGAIVGWFVGSAVGALAGVIGAVIGTYAGYYARIAGAQRLGAFPAAFAEDAIAVGLGVLAVSR